MNLYVFSPVGFLSIEIEFFFFFIQLPPEEDVKRKQRRDRNKQAAAKCRRKRNDLRETLEKVRSSFSSRDYLHIFHLD